MKCLVTGMAGFIGSHVSEALLKRGDSVIGIDDFNRHYDVEIKSANLGRLQTFAAFRHYKGDIADYDLMRKVFREVEPDAVVHLAARAGVRASSEEPALYQRVNVSGTANILERCRWHNPGSIVIASSSSVYGERNTFPFREDDVPAPISVYGATKLMCETLAAAYSRNYGLNIACPRFFTVVGARGRPDMAAGKFIRKILLGDEIPVYGDWEKTRRSYTDVSDIVRGVLAMVDNPRPFEIVNLGNPKTCKLKKIVNTLEEIIDKKARIKHLPAQPGDVSQTCADVSRALELYGWKPVVPLEKSLRSQAAYVFNRLLSESKALPSSPEPSRQAKVEQ